MVIEESHADHVRMIMAAASGDCSIGDVEPHIIRSWSRCVRSYGLNPEEQCELAVVGSSSLQQRRETLHEALDVAEVELQRLHQQIAGSGYAIVLTDADGVILHRVTDPSVEHIFTSSGLVCGASWSEDVAGTNGMGTCLIEGAPVTVHRAEHFRTAYAELTCSAAPIHDPQGQLVAALDASSVNSRDSRSSQLHTMALVKMSAAVIENFLFLQRYRDAWVLRFHSRPEFVGLLGEAMLAIDAEGRVLAANPSAVSLLHQNARLDLVEQPLRSVFDLSLDQLQLLSLRAGTGVWPIRSAVSSNTFFATVRGPAALPVRRVLSLRPRVATVFRRPPGDPGLSLRMLAGRDPVMIQNAEEALRVLNNDVPITLCGESGVGKESFARALHLAGERAKQPFVAVHCSTLPQDRAELELFGSGAHANTGIVRGRLSQAHGGTLYLDEVADLPLALQARLLRVLEDQEVLPVGGERPQHVDVQVIASSRRDLETLVREGALREDLYYRLDGLTLTLPPLRGRVDIKQLIDSLLDMENPSDRPAVVEPAAMKLLLGYDWPGNVRQLRNVIRRALALSADGRVRVSDLPETLGSAEQRSLSVTEFGAAINVAAPLGASARLEEAERGALMRELELRRWNVTTTASALGISRNTLYRRMKRLGIPPSQRHLAEAN